MAALLRYQLGIEQIRRDSVSQLDSSARLGKGQSDRRALAHMTHAANTRRLSMRRKVPPILMLPSTEPEARRSMASAEESDRRGEPSIVERAGLIRWIESTGMKPHGRLDALRTALNAVHTKTPSLSSHIIKPAIRQVEGPGRTPESPRSRRERLLHRKALPAPENGTGWQGGARQGEHGHA